MKKIKWLVIAMLSLLVFALPVQAFASKDTTELNIQAAIDENMDDYYSENLEIVAQKKVKKMQFDKAVVLGEQLETKSDLSPEEEAILSAVNKRINSLDIITNVMIVSGVVIVLSWIGIVKLDGRNTVEDPPLLIISFLGAAGGVVTIITSSFLLLLI